MTQFAQEGIVCARFAKAERREFQTADSIFDRFQRTLGKRPIGFVTLQNEAVEPDKIGFSRLRKANAVAHLADLAADSISSS